jgi:hypothetical protein
MRSPLVALVLLACARPPAASFHLVPGAPHPEDLCELPGTSLVLVSAMKKGTAPGGLFVLDRETEAVVALPSAVGLPHGIDVRRLDNDRFEALVVDHGGGEWIDRLSLRVRGRAVTVEAQDRIAMPPGTSANGVAAIGDDDFVATSMFDPREAYVDKLARGEATGRLWRWSKAERWRPVSAPLSGANGVAIVGGAAFVSEWAAKRFWRIPLDGAAASFRAVDFLPDNVRRAPDGRLLVAGQRARPEVLFRCQDDCPRGFSVVSFDPSSLAMERIYEGETRGSGAATVAIADGGGLWLGTYDGDYITRARMAR